MNQIATAMSSRAISAQTRTTALLLSAVLIALDTRTKSSPPSPCNSHLLDEMLKPLYIITSVTNYNYNYIKTPILRI